MNNKFSDGWKHASMTEARWPRNTATGSGGGLLLILRYDSVIKEKGHMPSGTKNSDIISKMLATKAQYDFL